MIQGVLIEPGVYGKRAVITGAWSDEITALLVSSQIAEIELNDGKGWRGDDLSFLESFPKLKSFTIIDLRIMSIEPIQQLHDLVELKAVTYAKSRVDLSSYRDLEICSIEWRPGFCGLSESRKLKSLFVNRFPGKDSGAFASLTFLEKLGILNSPVGSLADLGALHRLRSLRLGNLRRLESLAGLEKLVNLEELEIITCRKIRRIDQLSQLVRLRRLNLDNDGEIESLEPLRRLTALEQLTFVESTNILDGDLSPIRKPRLTKVAYKDRPHYSMREEALVRPTIVDERRA